MRHVPQNDIEPLPVIGNYWEPEIRQARLERELERHGLSLDGNWGDVHDDSMERARIRACYKHILDLSTSVPDLNKHINCIQHLLCNNLPFRDEDETLIDPWGREMKYQDGQWILTDSKWVAKGGWWVLQ